LAKVTSPPRPGGGDPVGPAIFAKGGGLLAIFAKSCKDERDFCQKS
jgi:hypothetical protein